MPEPTQLICSDVSTLTYMLIAFHVRKDQTTSEDNLKQRLETPRKPFQNDS